MQYLQLVLVLCLTLVSEAAPPTQRDGRQVLKSDGLHGIRIKLSRSLPTKELPETSYYGAVSFGETRENKFNVVFDTKTSQVWVPEYKSPPVIYNELHYYCGYDASISPGAILIQQDAARFGYQNITLRGSLYEDTMTLYKDASKDEIISSTDMINIKNRFYSINWAEDYNLREKVFDGVVGLATRVDLVELQLNNTQRALQPEFIRLQQEQDPDFPYTPNSGLIMGLWINPDLGETNFAGELTLGTYEGGKVHFPSLEFHNTSSIDAWQLELKEVKLSSESQPDSEVVSCRFGCQAILDSGNDSLVGPAEDIGVIRTRLDAKYNEELQLWTVKSCQDLEFLPALTFTFGNPNKEYKLTANQYTAKLNLDDQQICYLTLKAGEGSDWLLGTSFLQAYYTIFDLGSGHVGLAEFKNKMWLI